MDLKRIPLSKIKTAEYNPRYISPLSYSRLKASLQEFGQRVNLVGGISLPYSQEMRKVAKWTHANARFQTAYIVRTNHFCPPECEKVSVFEDFYSYIYLRSQNFVILRYGLAGIDCLPIGGGTGGHQDFDRRARAEAEIEILRNNAYPDLKVRAVKKPWGIEPKLSGSFFGVKSLV